MGWEDRDYHRERGRTGGGGGGSAVGGIFAVLNWSFPIGTVFNIRVRLHITFVLLALFETLSAGQNWMWALRWIALLFVSVLLHEFGHCLACRRVGGTANDILMWPLGGLAFVAPPRRPWPEFWTTAWGPLVTFFLALGSYAYLSARFGLERFVSINPFQMFRSGWSLYEELFTASPTWLDLLVRDLYYVNVGLLLFNLLLVFYPFDGGRLIQEVLWMFIGYARSMWWATRFGLVGAFLAAVYGIYSAQLFLFFIAVFGGIACYQQMQMLRHEGAAEPFDEVYYSPTPAKRSWLARWRAQRAQKRSQAAEREDARLQAEVDRILDKVREHGLHSLTRAEKKILQRATERQRRVG